MTRSFVPLPRIAALSVAISLLAAPNAATQSVAPGAQAQTLTMKGYPAVGAPPVITLLRPGAAPRTQLRYVIPANQKARMDVTMNLSMASTGALGKVVSKDVQTMPTVKVTADLGVTSVAPNGDITYDLAFTGMTLEARAGVKPQEARGLQPLVASFTSIKGSVTVSNRGVTTSARVDAGNPAMRALLGQVISSIENLAIPFPDVAVGVAARWEVRQAMVFGDLTTFRPTVFQKTEYEVVSIDESRVSLKVKTEQTAPPQPLGDPSLPVSNQAILFGAENRLKKMSSSGTGTVVVHLDSLVPISERQSNTSMAMTTSVNEQAASLTVDADVKITIAPPGMAPATAPPDLKALRGITAVNLGGTHDSTVGPDRVCYPRPPNAPGGDRAGVSIAMGGLLRAATEVLKAGGIETSPRVKDFLKIDAQILDAAQCWAIITLELQRGLGPERHSFSQSGQLIVGWAPGPGVWRRTFEVQGVPAGFAARVLARFEQAVSDFARDVAQANLR